MKTEEVRIDQPGSATFSIQSIGREEVVSADWTLRDRSGQIVTLPEFTGRPARRMVKHTIQPNVIELICPSDPQYSRLSLTADITFRVPGKTPRTANRIWIVRFNQPWGGMMRAQCPYPANWGKRWDEDERGKRALVLMYDLINQMPDGLRQAAGSIPIVWYEKLPMDFAQGFHAPYVSDCIIITDAFVNMVSPRSPTLTAGDLYFVSVVLHEIAHAITYNRSSTNIHQSLSPLLHALRSVPEPGVQIASYGLPAVIAAVHSLLFEDFVSDYARVSDWELAGWIVRFIRFNSVVGPALDLIRWLSHRGEEKGYPTLRPNVITGYWAIGNIPILWLCNKKRDFNVVKILKEQERDLWLAYLAESNPKKRGPIERQWKRKRDELIAALATAGVVSQYATVDVLEDIAETITAITFSAEQLNAKLREPGGYASADLFVTTRPDGTSHPGFTARRKFLTKAGLFPKNWSKLVPGDFLKGRESEPHLDEWTVTL